MPPRQALPKLLDSINHERNARRQQRPRQSTTRSGKKLITDIRMRSPSPQGCYIPGPDDKDQTLINRNHDDDDDEWTDDESATPTDDDAYFHWEEEATLFSDLLEEAYASATLHCRLNLISKKIFCTSVIPRRPVMPNSSL